MSSLLPAYAELRCVTNFSFLKGASRPEEVVERAKSLGYTALAVTDECSMAGIVRAHVAAREAGVRLVVGCRLELAEPELSLLVYPTDRGAYARLCRLLTLGKRRAEKGKCHLTLRDLPDHAEGLLAVAVPPGDADGLDDGFADPVVGRRPVLHRPDGRRESQGLGDGGELAVHGVILRGRPTRIIRPWTAPTHRASPRPAPVAWPG